MALILQTLKHKLFIVIGYGCNQSRSGFANNRALL